VTCIVRGHALRLVVKMQLTRRLLPCEGSPAPLVRDKPTGQNASRSATLLNARKDGKDRPTDRRRAGGDSAGQTSVTRRLKIAFAVSTNRERTT
jgi:hypothetical protein